MAAALAPQDLTEDSICPNVTQNIFVVCTPSERNARAYTTVQQLRLRDTLYRVAVYPAPPDDTCKGVIRGIDLDLNDNQLRELIVTKRNPSALEVKRIKNTPAVTILFQGMQVPNYVYCGASISSMHAFPQAHGDVCPNPNTTWCRTCGLKTPPENHQCKPHCTLCGGPHPTADKDCKRKFQVPYIVRQRRRRRRQRGRSRSRGPSGASSRNSSATSSTSAASRRSRSVTPAARLQGKQQSQRSPPPTKQVTRPSLPEHESEIVTTLRQELAGLRATIQQLTTQLNDARQQIQTLTAPKPVPSPSVDVSKPKRRAPSLSETVSGDSDTSQDTLNEILRLTRENNESIHTLSRRVEALEQKATIKAKHKAKQALPTDPTAHLPGPANLI
ncbi:hypothetical protein HPB52_025561 [Rhipicephalus sanguineus]|uniref:Uncharacterized protein n=1 Tax=Rhipicephalus sanguineus TaxID=34632 RepID=A0A9D4SLL0_RHISA|nr:hypothetical protein HPB52_025561 [Rhipicephalus sanguineus]